MDPLNDKQLVTIAYNRSAGYVRWLIGGIEMFKIVQLGFGLEPSLCITDFGGNDEIVDSESFNIGFGTVDWLDATVPYNPGNLNVSALVQLIPNPNRYLNPHTIPGTPQTFFDSSSQDSNRIFNQSATLHVDSITISTFNTNNNGNGNGNNNSTSIGAYILSVIGLILIIVLFVLIFSK